jgi:hypothetical protein
MLSTYFVIHHASWHAAWEYIPQATPSQSSLQIINTWQYRPIEHIFLTFWYHPWHFCVAFICHFQHSAIHLNSHLWPERAIICPSLLHLPQVQEKVRSTQLRWIEVLICPSVTSRSGVSRSGVFSTVRKNARRRWAIMGGVTYPRTVFTGISNLKVIKMSQVTPPSSKQRHGVAKEKAYARKITQTMGICWRRMPLYLCMCMTCDSPESGCASSEH